MRFMTPHTILFRSIVLLNEANSFCYAWLRVTHVRISTIFHSRYPTWEAGSHSYAYATPRLYPTSRWKLQKCAQKTSLDLQKDLIHAGVHICSRTMRRRPLSVSNPGFSRTRKPFFFNYQTRVYKKSWDCCCIQILVILTTLKLQISGCNGQISKCELSAIIMRHEVRVLLGHHRTFVGGPLIFSLNWPI